MRDAFHVCVDDCLLAKRELASENEDASPDVVEGRRPNSRLSCRTILAEQLEGLTVRLARNARLA